MVGGAGDVDEAMRGKLLTEAGSRSSSGPAKRSRSLHETVLANKFSENESHRNYTEQS